MRVLHVTPYLAPVFGGVSRVVEALIPALRQEGVTVEVASTEAGFRRGVRGNGLEVFDRVTTSHLSPLTSIQTYVFPSLSRNDLVWSSPLLRWLAESVRDYDLVHTHTIFSPMMSMVVSIARHRGVPYVVTPHGMLDPWALAYKSWRKRPYWFFVERDLLQGAAFLHALHSEEGDQLCRQGVELPVVVAPNGFGAGFEVSGEGAGVHDGSRPLTSDPLPLTPITHPRYLLFLSRIDPKKGLDLLLPAFAKVKRVFPEVELVIAGPDEIGYRAELERRFPTAGVRFVGMVQGEEKAKLFKSAELFILPSYSEGFSMAVLEAMGAGVPTVISRECHFSEAIQEGMAWEIPLEVDGIAERLIGMLQNRHEIQARAAQAAEWVRERYTWSKSARRLVEGYQSVLRK